MSRLHERMRITPEGFFGDMLSDGNMFTVNLGSETTPVTFAGAYDADGPDGYIFVPDGTTIVPYHIRVVFEDVGTEAVMEVIALASTIGDSTATVTGGGTATPINMLLGAGKASGVTASYGVDAGGITSPRSGNADHEFWRDGRPLTDTAATGENDRHRLVFTWQAFRDGMPPVIKGTATTGACLAIHAASQAGTGFITVQYAEMATAALL